MHSEYIKHIWLLTTVPCTVINMPPPMNHTSTHPHLNEKYIPWTRPFLSCSKQVISYFIYTWNLIRKLLITNPPDKKKAWGKADLPDPEWQVNYVWSQCWVKWTRHRAGERYNHKINSRTTGRIRRVFWSSRRVIEIQFHRMDTAVEIIKRGWQSPLNDVVHAALKQRKRRPEVERG